MATPSGIEDAIEAFEARVFELGLEPEHLHGARPPIADEELHVVIARIRPLRLPESVISVLRWHNGGFQLDLSTWYSLDEAFAARDRAQADEVAAAARRREQPFPVPDQWLPIAGWGGLWDFVEVLPDARTESKTWHFAASDGSAVDAKYSSVEMMFRVATAKLGKPDEYQSTELDFALDPGYARHEYIECLPEELPEVWPARWDFYPPGPAKCQVFDSVRGSGNNPTKSVVPSHLMIGSHWSGTG